MGHDLGSAANMPVMSRNVIGRFFETFERKPEARDAFEQGVDSFCERVRERAVVKAKELEEEEKAEAAEPETRLLVDAMYDMKPEDRQGPGGLDPVEVFESLPPLMQKCFKSGSSEMMQKAGDDIPDFEHHIHRCIGA